MKSQESTVYQAAAFRSQRKAPYDQFWINENLSLAGIENIRVRGDQFGQ